MEWTVIRRLLVITITLSFIGCMIHTMYTNTEEGGLVKSEERFEVVDFDLVYGVVVYKYDEIVEKRKLIYHDDVIKSNETYLLKTTLNNGNVYYVFYVNLSDVHEVEQDE